MSACPTGELQQRAERDAGVAALSDGEQDEAERGDAPASSGEQRVAAAAVPEPPSSAAAAPRSATRPSSRTHRAMSSSVELIGVVVAGAGRGAQPMPATWTPKENVPRVA